MMELNEEQAHFIRTKLIPFTQNLGRQTDFVKTLEIILKQGHYDRVDKIIIEFLMNKMRSLEE